MLDKYSK